MPKFTAHIEQLQAAESFFRSWQWYSYSKYDFPLTTNREDSH